MLIAEACRGARTKLGSCLTFAVAIGCHDATSASPAARAPSTVTVRVLTLDGEALSDGFVVARHSSGAIDSLRLSGSTNSVATLGAAPGESVSLRVGADEARRYHPSSGSVLVNSDTAIDVILIPTTWDIRVGRYAGASRPIDLVKAFGSDANDTHFLNRFAPTPDILVAWPEDMLPIAVGLDTTGATQRWSAADSAWFWTSITDINDAVGRQVFAPVASVALTTRRVIGIRLDFTNYSPPEANLASNLDVCRPPARLCDDVHGIVLLSRGTFYRSVFDDETFRVFQHEMMHALGFGHECGWSSVVMLTGEGCSTTIPADVTADDVAYMSLVFRLAGMLKAHPHAWHLTEALTAARERP